MTQHILLIEQESDKNDRMRNLIYKVDLSKASDLTALLTSRAKVPEFDDEKPAAAAAFILCGKTQVQVDLRALGWQQQESRKELRADRQQPGLTQWRTIMLTLASGGDTAKRPGRGQEAQRIIRLNAGRQTDARIDKPVGKAHAQREAASKKPESDGEAQWLALTLPEAVK